MSRKRTLQEAAINTTPDMNQLYLSPPINDRSSTFVAAFSAVLPYRAIQAIPAFSDATHRIAAWRVPSKQQRLLQDGKRNYDMGHDDDGESYAGKRIERVLETMDVEGSAVVARWYGGVLLGPVRFAHIEACARSAIIAWQESSKTTPVSDLEREKRHKLGDEKSVSHDALCDRLSERDQSIVVLRELLAEKTVKIARKTPAQDPLHSTTRTSTPSHKSARVASDYKSMALDTLMRLERARDNTIAFLLKQIDRAETGNDHSDADGRGEAIPASNTQQATPETNILTEADATSPSVD